MSLDRPATAVLEGASFFRGVLEVIDTFLDSRSGVCAVYRLGFDARSPTTVVHSRTYQRFTAPLVT
jgi:hypothetical protein